MITRAPLSQAPLYVDLVAPPRPKAPARAAPAAKPVKARQTIDQPLVLKPKPAPPKPKPQPVAKPEKAEPAPKPARIPSAAEILAQLREQAESEGEEAAPAEPARRGGRFDPELAAYTRRVKTLLRANWGGAAAFKGEEGLAARFEVQLDARGRIQEVAPVRSSGNSYFDGSAERAIRASEPFPEPPRGPITLDLVFNPEGVF
jgi:TonB family protein